jgi:glycogen debranching enzyme
MAGYPAADVLQGEKVLSAEEILTPEDLVFDPATRPRLEVAMQRITGIVAGREVPFASATLAHHGQTPDQGLFTCLFGRDSLVIAGLSKEFGKDIRLQVVCALAEHQGSGVDLASEEQPGRIPHEIRDSNDPQAIRIQSESGWGFPYYGSVDATLLWLATLDQLSQSDAEILQIDILGSSISRRAESATRWLIDRLGEGGGLLRSNRTNPKGILNQVWKDSGDSYLTAKGEVATQSGTASVETIGESFDALMAASRLAERSAERWDFSPSELVAMAIQLKAKLVENWWLGDRFAMGSGLIRDSETQLDAIASNQWRLLDSEILSGPDCSEFASNLIQSVCDPEILGPHGIRTLGKSNPRYRPAGYHTGSSWPVDSALIVRGLLRHGAKPEAAEIAKRTVSAIDAVGGYPELFRSDLAETAGVSRFIIDVWDPAINSSNRVSQPPQLLQGWTIASYGFLKRQGLQPGGN